MLRLFDCPGRRQRQSSAMKPSTKILISALFCAFCANAQGDVVSEISNLGTNFADAWSSDSVSPRKLWEDSLQFPRPPELRVQCMPWHLHLSLAVRNSRTLELYSAVFSLFEPSQPVTFHIRVPQICWEAHNTSAFAELILQGKCKVDCHLCIRKAMFLVSRGSHIPERRQ